MEKSLSKERNRIKWLDVARCFAIVSISSNHAINRAFRDVGTSYDAFTVLPHVESILRAFIVIFSRIGAPMFLMISGALLLKKKMENAEDVMRFYKHNLLGILITSEIWYFLMFWYRTIFVNDILKSGGVLYAIKRCIETMFFINQETMGNMWYIPMILCIYLIIPVFNITLHKIGNKILVLPMTVVLLSSMIVPSINQICEIAGKGISIDFNLKSANVFSMYMIYVLLGYLISEGFLKRLSNATVFALSFFIFTVCSIVQYWEYSIPGDNDIKYDFFLLAVCCTLVFETIRRFTNRKKENRIVTYISKISFGIFFVHIFIVSAVAGVFRFNGINKIIVFVILEVTSVAGSIVLIYILSKITLFKKYLFCIKD